MCVGGGGLEGKGVINRGSRSEVRHSQGGMERFIGLDVKDLDLRSGSDTHQA